jgi:uncharacterized protein
LLATPSNGATAQSLQINWGDGSAAQSLSTTATSATYSYSAAGTYTVTITFTDSASKVATKQASIVMSAAAPAVPDLFFSEYVEGSGSNKALEIYNPKAAAVDLSAYTLRVYFNGTTTASVSLTLTGSLSAGQVFVIANSGGSASLTLTANLLLGGGVVNFNGDDAITLEKNGVVIDRIGQVGNDPGVAWTSGTVTTLDATLQRKAGITRGDSASTSAFDPALQWNALPNNTFSGLGSHSP